MISGRQPILRLRNIHHAYGDTKALQGVDFDLYPGEIHALVGDHYSGKSSLVRIISGDMRLQRGSIAIHGNTLDYLTPKLALKWKIAAMYQDPKVIPSLDAVENVFAGRLKPLWFPFATTGPMLRQTKQLFDELGVEFDLTRPAGSLSREQKQMIEVARCFSINPSILILDEIANRLHPEQVERLFAILHEYRRTGTAVIYITTDMQDVLKRADRVTVLRGGFRRATEQVSELDIFNLLKLTHNFAFDIEESDAVNDQAALAGLYNRDMMRHLPVGVLILDEEGRIYAANPAAKRVLNLGDQPVAGIRFAEIESLKQSDRYREIVQSVEQGIRESWNDVLLAEDRVVNVRLFPIFRHSESVQGCIVLIENVSVDRSVREYLARAEKATSIAELAAGVAHEVNNPLGIIQNYVELLKLESVSDAQQDRIAKIEKELERIVKIVGSLLSFSRVRVPRSSRVDMGDVVEEVLLLLGHKLGEKHVELERHLLASSPVVMGDENRLKQVVMNLLVNSIESVLDYGHIEVRVESSDDRGYCEVSISDDGHGIPPEIQDEIFTPFYSTKTYKSNTGLGLAICQHLVEAHGGVLTFDSTPGEYTTFVIRLPLADASVASSSIA